MKKATETTITIHPLKITRIPFRIVGDTPLIVHAWSDKAKKMMLDTQTGATKVSAKPKREPFAEFIDSMYWLTDKPDPTPEAFEKAVRGGAEWGFPVAAIKLAANSAAYRLKWVKNQMELRGTYYLQTDHGYMAKICGSLPEMREDMVRIGMGSADLRYRAEFKNWYMDFVLEYTESGGMTAEQIINCINAGGFVCGVGEWRPEKDGMSGRFHVEALPE